MKSVKKHSQLSRLVISSLTFLLFFTLKLSAQEGDATKGKQLFNTNCVACHKLEKKLIGPALKGMDEKRSREWLHAWIKDSQALIKSGDADAQEVFKEYNNIPMQAFPHLSEQDIDDIIAYTKGEPAKAQEAAPAAAQVSPEQAEAIAAGESLFKANCAACHKLDKKSIGPALRKIGDKRDIDWLKAWIKDNNALRASGDQDAIDIFNEYNGAVMTPFPQLSDKDIENIVAYTAQDPVAADPTTGVVEEVKVESSTAWMSYVVMVILLLIILYIYYKSDNWFLKIAATIILLFTLAYVGFSALMGVGVDQGYQPIQPIAFSHKIHAGDNKIDCQYCHSSAKNSKTSGIPSVNVCMNCHKNISEYTGPVTSEHSKEFYDGEIQKLYAAAGWDSENLKYTGEQKPIEWVRVHNLPDFVYYNHSQHVTVGGQKCQKCHGPVEEMDEVYQYSPLTMGWCIDCHKETNVKMEGNDYYKKIHEQLSKKYGVEKVTVAQMGGKECGKCHY